MKTLMQAQDGDDVVDHYLIDFSRKAKLPIGDHIKMNRSGKAAAMLAELGFDLNSWKLVRGIAYVDAINNQHVQCEKIGKGHYRVFNDQDVVLDIQVKFGALLGDFVLINDLRRPEANPIAITAGAVPTVAVFVTTTPSATTPPVVQAFVMTSTQSSLPLMSASLNVAEALNLTRSELGRFTEF